MRVRLRPKKTPKKSDFATQSAHSVYGTRSKNLAQITCFACYPWYVFGGVDRDRPNDMDAASLFTQFSRGAN